jgi:hypothetical protein
MRRCHAVVRFEIYTPAVASRTDGAVNDLLGHLDAKRPMIDNKFMGWRMPGHPPPRKCLVAWRDDGVAVGFVAGRRRDDFSGSDGTVGLLEVIGTRLHHGVARLGAQLVEQFEALMVTEGCTELALKVAASPKELENTLRFFHELGFIPRGEYYWRPI